MVVFLLITLCTVAGSPTSFCQEVKTAPQTEPSPQPENIEYAEIPIRSVEVINQTRQAFHDLIPTNTIIKLRVNNARVLASVDTTLLKPLDTEDPTLNFRHLETRKLSLLREQKKLADEEARLREVIGTLDKLSNRLTRQDSLWYATRKAMLRDTLLRPVPAKVEITITFLDSAIGLVTVKSNALMEILEKTIAIGVNIDLYLERTNTVIRLKQMNAFTGDHTPFFSLDFTAGYMDAFRSSWHNITELKIKVLMGYIRSNLFSILGMLLLFFGIAWFFIVLKRNIRVNLEGYGRFYKEMLLLLLSRPYSSAIILMIMSASIFFPDRPLILREFTAYFVAYPLLILLNAILQKKYNVYLYAFSSVVVIYMILLLVASETVLYRILLILISLAEIGLLTLLFHRFRTRPAFNGRTNYLIIAFVLLHLGFAVTGLISNLAGRVLMTEMVLNAVFVNINYGVILFISVIILNGLVVSGVDSPQGRSLNSLRKHGEFVKKRAIGLLNGIAVLYWIWLILMAFRISDYVAGFISSIFTQTYSIGSASFSLNAVAIFFAVIYVSVVFSKLLKVILEDDVLSILPLSKGLPHTIAMGVKYCLIVAGFLLAVNAAGIPVDKLTIILGAFSVGIGFGLQNIFSNMVSGLILLFERPIQIGDTVQVGQLIGNVKSIDLRSSNIHTFDGAEVIVPNGQLVSNEVINWTLSDKKRRLEIPVGVAYESDPPFVHKLLLQILNGHPEVLKDPEPLVFFSGLGESSLDFVLLFWIGDYNEGRRLKSDILFNLFAVLKENGVTIPFPQRDVHIK